MFEKASRAKLRFDSERGQLTIEDLWDLPLSSGKVNLNDLAKSASRAIRESSEEDFVGKKTKVEEDHELRLEILKHVISVRIEEAEVKKRAESDAGRKKIIAGIIEKKKMQDLESLPIDELIKLLDQ